MRDTDLKDASGDVGTAFQHDIPDGAPEIRFHDVAKE
jgi:hypothetical protein